MKYKLFEEYNKAGIQKIEWSDMELSEWDRYRMMDAISPIGYLPPDSDSEFGVVLMVLQTTNNKFISINLTIGLIADKPMVKYLYNLDEITGDEENFEEYVKASPAKIEWVNSYGGTTSYILYDYLNMEEDDIDKIQTDLPPTTIGIIKKAVSTIEPNENINDLNPKEKRIWEKLVQKYSSLNKLNFEDEFSKYVTQAIQQINP